MAQPKQISQETFDAVVRENVEEFEMDLGEAIQDAKEQFKTQGVDLSNLITSYIVDPDTGDLKHTNPVKGNVYAADASRERVFFLISTAKYPATIVYPMANLFKNESKNKERFWYSIRHKWVVGFFRI